MGTTDTTPAKLTVTKTPFDNIGLAFSGGGFLAASFSLGTLSYLNELKQDNDVPLLQNATYIASVSGGAIPTTMYALYNSQGKDFNEYYKDIFTNLQGVTVIDHVFKNLNDDSVWKKHKHKRRNLVNSFALSYDELLFNGKCAGDLFLEDPKTHLEEVCFITTDFYRGLLFRQAIKLKADPKEATLKKDGGLNNGSNVDESFLYGNFIVHLENGIEKKLRLSDILAASSCFPGGFEPIIFPGDFANDKLNVETLLANTHIALQELKWPELDMLYKDHLIKKEVEQFPKPIVVDALAEKIETHGIKKEFEAGFMDGGISDNQGIESLMRANDRRVKEETGFKQFDLMLVSDVLGPYMDPFKPSENKKNYTGINGLSINNVFSICCVFIAIGFAGLFFSFYQPSAGVSSKIVVIASTLAVVIFGSVLAGILLLKQFIGGKLKGGKGLDLSRTFSENIVKNMFDHFGKTPLGVIIQMVKDRISSVLTLNFSVFLNRVRQILYHQYMDEGRRTFRMKTNHVYDLSFSNDLNRINYDSKDLQPSSAIQTVAQHAFEMATALWFDTTNQKEDTQAAVIASGQFTTCYNLLEYISRMRSAKSGPSYYSTLDEQNRDKINKLEARLMEHYDLFKKDPFWLYNKLIDRSRLPETNKCTMSKFPFPGKNFKGLR